MKGKGVKVERAIEGPLCGLAEDIDTRVRHKDHLLHHTTINHRAEKVTSIHGFGQSGWQQVQFVIGSYVWV